ncbi:MAG: SPOR domain-containing protein [Terriglobia bacterium]
MATEVREREERSHSARYLALIFLVCVATCGVFFSLGFLVGYNERGSHADLSTEAVSPPPVIPPTVNPPPDSAPATAQDPAAGHATPDSVPETEVLTPGPTAGNPPLTSARRADVEPPAATAKPNSNPLSPPKPAAGQVGEGITLQVAALRTKQDGEALVDVLKSRGYPVFLLTPEHAHAADNLFRVQVGPFRTRADADKVHDKLVQEGFKPFIRH